MLGSIEKSLPLFRHESSRNRVAGFARDERGGSRSGPGLSKGHTLTNSLHVWEGAGLLTVKTPYESPDVWKGAEEKEEESPVVRGKIAGYSKKSQSRARQTLGKFSDDVIMKGLLVTLTYPDEFPVAEDFKVYKRHQERMYQELRRAFPGSSGMWFLEFQQRGAPHFHVIAFGIPHSQLRKMQRFVSETWYRIVNSGDPKHLEAGTRVETPKSPGKARGYLSKYLSKGDQKEIDQNCGRFWGFYGRADLPLAQETVTELTEGQAKIVMRVCRSAIKRRVASSSWGRLRRSLAEHETSFRFVSDSEFRRVCEKVSRGFKSGRFDAFTTVDVTTSRGSLSLSAYFFWQSLCKASGTDRPRFPKPWRLRNNSTLNLLCDASQFRDTLTRHPEWNDYEKKAKQETASSGAGNRGTHNTGSRVRSRAQREGEVRSVCSNDERISEGSPDYGYGVQGDPYILEHDRVFDLHDRERERGPVSQGSKVRRYQLRKDDWKFSDVPF